MSLLNKKLIRTDNEEIDYGAFVADILPEVCYVYGQTERDRLLQLTGGKDIRIIAEYKDLSDCQKEYCKRFFNCLRPFDDLLFFDRNSAFLCAVPYSLYDMFDCLATVDAYAYGLDGASADVFRYFVLYHITKDLGYLSKIIATGIELPPELFSLSKKLVDRPNPEKIAILDNIAVFLRGEEPLAFVHMDDFLGDLKNWARRDHDKKVARAAEEIEKGRGRKNLVVLHLESLSNEIYYNNRRYLRNLTELMDMSVQLDCFYTSASSSIMALYDFFYGNDFEIENYASYGMIYHDRPISTHMYETLRRDGYEVLGIGYNDHPGGEEVNRQRLWNVEGQEYRWVTDFERFLDEMDSFIRTCRENGKPFAMHVWDLLTHSGHYCEETASVPTYADKAALSFVSVDVMIERVMHCLRENDLLDDTIIVGYGDHGDDMWTRDMNYGFTHVTTPYRNVIWTPAFLYDSRVEPFLYENLASMTDLKYTALFALGVEDGDTFPYGGINLFKEKNDFVYSRSLIFNQREYETIRSHAMVRLNGYNDQEVKNKAFAVIGEAYGLVAGKDGLELFINGTDPFQYNNVLNFIDFDGELTPVRMNNHRAWRGHFRSMMMRDAQVYEILYCLRVLLEKLTERLELKMAMLEGGERYVFDFEYLKRVKSRGFVWE